MLNDKIYQMIFDEIRFYFPENWNQVVIYLEYGEASYSFSFYVRLNGEYIKCYNLPNINEEQLMDSFGRIDKAITVEREKEDGDLWSNMTMIVDAEGNMHVDFDYTDLSECGYQYSKEWKEKYLK